MSYPKTYTAFRRTIGPLPNTIKQTQESLPNQLGPHDVVIKIHAVSLNYREHATLIGTYPPRIDDGGIPCSDAAAEVVATGPAVKTFKVGDPVSPITGQGPFEDTDDGNSVAIGFSKDGVLREYAVYEEKHLVHLPKNVSWEEGSILACAGVTAWTALDRLEHIPKRASALMQGTGGVSIIALLLCNAAGIKPIITSSSDEKIKALQELYPEVRGINYKTTSNMDAEVKYLTDGRGVDFVINNTGPQSIMEDVGFLCGRRGTVSLVGFLHGFDADWEARRLMELMVKQAKIQGIAVGSKADFEELNRFLEEKDVKLKLALDRVFEFKDSKAAFEYLGSGKHTGKIVIKVAE